MAVKDSLTAADLRKLFRYDPNNGRLTHAMRRSGVRFGSVAGNLCVHHGYIQVYVRRRNYLAHRLIWLMVYGEWPSHQIDHVNLDRSDNRLCNLREATNKQNSENHSIRADNVSGVTGVCWSTSNLCWRAYIGHFGRQRDLGYFDTKAAAIEARIKAEREIFTHSTHPRNAT